MIPDIPGAASVGLGFCLGRPHRVGLQGSNVKGLQ